MLILEWCSAGCSCSVVLSGPILLVVSTAVAVSALHFHGELATAACSHLHVSCSSALRATWTGVSCEDTWGGCSSLWSIWYTCDICTLALSNLQALFGNGTWQSRGLGQWSCSSQNHTCRLALCYGYPGASRSQVDSCSWSYNSHI